MPPEAALALLCLGLFLAAAGILLALRLAQSRALRALASAIKRAGEGGRRLRLHSRSAALGEVEIELNALLARFEESRKENLLMQRDRRLMISHVAHDLRTPLTAALGYLDALSGDPSLDARERDEYLQVVRRKCALLSDLIDDFFALSSLELGEAPPEPRAIDLCDLAERVLIAFYADFIALKIEPEIRIPDRPVTVIAAPRQVERIIANLLSNAVRHGRGATRLAFSVEEAGGRAVCRVANDGVGIDPARLRELMERPFGADDGPGGGARGLGLSIVKRLVEGMGGELSIGGSGGSGAEIAFSLPCAAKSAPAS
jgi:two-component system, OmpR family, phosphate regulon sensor histidine kinase PhoR